MEEIMVIAHYDCGMNGLNSKSFLEKAHQYGVATEKVDVLRDAGINLDHWLTGFTNVEDSVCDTVQTIKRHPLMPANIAVHGLVIHPITGKLTLVVDGKIS